MQENGSYIGERAFAQRGRTFKDLRYREGTSVEELELIEILPITKTCPHSSIKYVLLIRSNY